MYSDGMCNTTTIQCPHCGNDNVSKMWCDDIDHSPFFNNFMTGDVLCEVCDRHFTVYFSVSEITWEPTDIFPTEFTTRGGKTLVLCENFKVGTLSSGEDGVTALMQEGVLYNAERLFTNICGEHTFATICCNLCVPDDFDEIKVYEYDDIELYVKGVVVNEQHTVVAAEVWAYRNGQELGDAYYIF